MKASKILSGAAAIVFGLNVLGTTVYAAPHNGKPAQRQSEQQHKQNEQRKFFLI